MTLYLVRPDPTLVAFSSCGTPEQREMADLASDAQQRMRRPESREGSADGPCE